MITPPLIVDGAFPTVIPACPLKGRARETRPLFVVQRSVYLRTRYGWIRIPRGYVTDFGSIPFLATAVTLAAFEPLGSHAGGALGHDWRFAIGEPGKFELANTIFDDQMKLDGTAPLKRAIMHKAVQVGGRGGYAKAQTWWATENFADPDTGAPLPPPFRREQAYDGQRWGMRPRPDWLEV